MVDNSGLEWRDTSFVSIIIDKPSIRLTAPDSLYAWGDTIRLHVDVFNKYNTITNIEWDLGNTGVFSSSRLYDTFCIAPKEAIQDYRSVIRITNNDGIVATDTVKASINLFAPATLAAGFKPRMGHTSLVFDNKMWVIGGSLYDGTILNDVWYSSDGSTWTEATASAAFAPRALHTSILYDNKMWVIGGGPLTNDVWYSSDGIAWARAIDSAPFAPRQEFASIVYDNKMWVLGGKGPYVPGPDLWGNDVWYSSDGAGWTKTNVLTRFPGRYQHTGIAYDNKIWVIGGLGNNDVWYSSDGNTWTEASASTAFSPRCAHSSIIYDNKMWVIGGANPNGEKNDAWYSSDGIIWKEASASAGFTPRQLFTSVVFHNRIWVIGGNTGQISHSFSNEVCRSGIFTLDK